MIFQPPGGLGSHYDDLASGVLRQNERPLTVRVSKLGLGKKTTFHVFPTICYHRIISISAWLVVNCLHVAVFHIASAYYQRCFHIPSCFAVWAKKSQEHP